MRQHLVFMHDAASAFEAHMPACSARPDLCHDGTQNSMRPLQELLAIQANGAKNIGFFGTRNMGFLHQKLIEILSYAMVLTGNHIYTSGGVGTNAAVIKGALRAERPDLLTVILPQSLGKQPEELHELLQQVQDLQCMEENDSLTLLEASQCASTFLLLARVMALFLWCICCCLRRCLLLHTSCGACQLHSASFKADKVRIGQKIAIYAGHGGCPCVIHGWCTGCCWTHFMFVHRRLNGDCACRLCNARIISNVQQIICFAFHDSKVVLKTCQEAREKSVIVTLCYLD